MITKPLTREEARGLARHECTVANCHAECVKQSIRIDDAIERLQVVKSELMAASYGNSKRLSADWDTAASLGHIAAALDKIV